MSVTRPHLWNYRNDLKRLPTLQSTMIFRFLLHLICVSTAVVSQMCSSSSSSNGTPRFHKISGVDCVSPAFYKVIPSLCSTLDCSLRCLQTSNCQAFTLTGGTQCGCKLFQFDKCSHRVQSVANCTNQVTVYVRSLPGVQPGSLCPPGYQYTKYGTSYKLVTSETVTWNLANQRCSQEAGLSKFADAIDLDEAKYLAGLKRSVSGQAHSGTYYLGGQIRTGAAASLENWLWVACNLTVSSSVWNSGEPSGGLNEHCATIFRFHLDGIADDNCWNSFNYMCECQSVF